jgi:hypothetical protein
MLIAVGITSADGLIAFYKHGHGPLAAQGIIFLVGQDFSCTGRTAASLAADLPRPARSSVQADTAARRKFRRYS